MIVDARDWYVESIDDVERAADALRDAVEHVVSLLREARAQRLAGTPLPVIVDWLVASEGLVVRRGAGEAFAAFEQALSVYRAGAIYALVEDEGCSFTEVGRRVGVSRQMAARLYREGRPDISREEGWT